MIWLAVNRVYFIVKSPLVENSTQLLDAFWGGLPWVDAGHHPGSAVHHCG